VAGLSGPQGGQRAGAGNRLGGGALAFLAVFREGAETVLFINALATTEGGWSAGLFAGLAAATAGLAVLFYFINLITRKIPLRPLFIITSAFLFAMAIKFIARRCRNSRNSRSCRSPN